MDTIGIYAKFSNAKVQKTVQEILKWAEKQGDEVVFEERSAKILEIGKRGRKLAKFVQMANPIVTLGGDGTLLKVARHTAELEHTIIGVNFGNLGFLTEIAPNEVVKYLESVKKGTATLAKRAILKAKVIRRGKEVFSNKALNDVVLLKSPEAALVELDISQGKIPMMRLRADGVIFATPTGSTAYSMAAGGSIAYPSLEVVLLTPICSHSLTNRPLILPLDEEYTVQVPDYHGDLVLSLDGTEDMDLKSKDKIIITKSVASVRFVRAEGKSYFDVLRNKLNWAMPNNSKT